jgi:hypothetical protein
VQATVQQPQRAPDGAPIHYERHRPEQTTLYRLVQQRRDKAWRAERAKEMILGRLRAPDAMSVEV